jgi:hypothetical protein
MGNLIESIRAAKGEFQLASRLGRFYLAIAEAIDAVLASGSAALAAAQYLEVAQTGGNGLVQLNNDVILNTIVAQQGIAYNTGTGVATLTAGRTYSLRAAGNIVNFVGGAPAFFDITWVDATSNTALSASVVGTWIPVTENSNQAPSNAVELIYKPSTNQTVKLRSTSSGGGTAQTVAGHFWAVIQQIA